MLVLSTLMVIAMNMPAFAQAQNLLTNPGFESPYVTLDGTPPREVAQGWTPWHVPAAAGAPSFENSQPEYYPTAPDTTRIRSGANAQEIMSFFATHRGGVYQRVTGIASGADLTFSVYAYVWSTTFDDVNSSEEDGDVTVQVGVDPTGGTDGQSANIVWSSAGERYDAYNQYTVSAKSSGTAVTVFIRSTVGFPVKNNLVYLDDASLTVAGAQPTNTATALPASSTPVPPTATSAPTNTPVPPTSTQTAVPASATATAAAAATSTVGATSTTLVDIATSTTAPSETATQPAATNTSAPILETATNVPATATSESVPATVTEASPTDVFRGTIVHTVLRGNTVAELATLYGSTTQAIIAANGLNENGLIFVGQGLVIPVRLAPPATSTPTSTPIIVVVTSTPVSVVSGPGSGTGTVYTVVSGDTLFRIAVRYNTTVATLAQLNGIVNPNRIQVGQRLIVTGSAPASPTVTPAPMSQVTATPVPAQRTYSVYPGDNLYRISLRFGVSMARIMQANGLSNPNLLYAGQVLIIP